MSSGCELDACPAGTRQAGRIAVGQTLAVSCVVADGQMLRNGSSGEPGYYEDQRWVRLVPGQLSKAAGCKRWHLRWGIVDHYVSVGPDGARGRRREHTEGVVAT